MTPEGIRAGRYVAFLRAINVGGRRVKMDTLTTLFDDLGVDEVRTFIASGNVIFSSRGAVKTLEAAIEQQLRDCLGYEVATFVRTAAEVADLAEREPFGDRSGAEKTTLQIGFLREAPNAATRRQVRELAGEVDDLAIEGRELFWLVRGGFSDSKLAGAKVEKVVGPMTLRNVTMLRRLVAKYPTA